MRATGARFAKWGLGLFLFGVFLSFGILGHYWHGASHTTGEAFIKNITLWWGCPWTLAVAVIQLGGLGMVALGLTQMVAGRNSAGDRRSVSLVLCVAGLLGIFAVGYLGYWVFDAIWPSFYYVPVPAGKNAWLGAQALCMAIYFAGFVAAFNGVREVLK